MSELKEMVDKWVESDKVDCDQFNSEFAWSNPPLEAQVSFLRFRLGKTMSFMAAILTLIADEKSQGKSDSPK